MATVFGSNQFAVPATSIFTAPAAVPGVSPVGFGKFGSFSPFTTGFPVPPLAPLAPPFPVPFGGPFFNEPFTVGKSQFGKVPATKTAFSPFGKGFTKTPFGKGFGKTPFGKGFGKTPFGKTPFGKFPETAFGNTAFAVPATTIVTGPSVI